MNPQETLLAYLSQCKERFPNILDIVLANDLISIVNNYYSPPPTQVTMQCPPAIAELASKLEPQVDYKSELEQLQKENEQLKSCHHLSYSDLWKKYTSLNEEKIAVERSHLDLTEKFGKLEDEHQKTQTRNRTISLQIDEYSKKETKFLQEISQLVSDKELLKESLNRSVEKHDKLKQDYEQVQKNCEVMAQCQSKLVVEHQELQRTLTATHKKADELQESLNKAQKDYVTKDKELFDLIRTYNVLKDSTDTLTKVLQDTTQELVDVKEQLAQAEQNCKLIDQKHSELSADYVQLEKTHSNLHAAYDLRRKEQVEMSNTINNIKKKYDELAACNNFLIEENKKLKAQQQELEQQLETSMDHGTCLLKRNDYLEGQQDENLVDALREQFLEEEAKTTSLRRLNKEILGVLTQLTNSFATYVHNNQ